MSLKVPINLLIFLPPGADPRVHVFPEDVRIRDAVGGRVHPEGVHVVLGGVEHESLAPGVPVGAGDDVEGVLLGLQLGEAVGEVVEGAVGVVRHGVDLGVLLGHGGAGTVQALLGVKSAFSKVQIRDSVFGLTRDWV